ncbi:hypothetical protein QE418_001691 [Microbacterium testaceum]|uniref:hypothetical protein n=1 Tax=Microbacterium TaxID=33882 RepID=UPI002785CA94|nr:MULTISPECIES: hypothetical protein [Microbacterium]MDQ1112243.1 hypothetical protein [Microbacterium testaceum]MDR6097221.1 hypothetical protein [Microbacterium sp. SORGH_AS_0454]
MNERSGIHVFILPSRSGGAPPAQRASATVRRWGPSVEIRSVPDRVVLVPGKPFDPRRNAIRAQKREQSAFLRVNRVFA